MMNAENKEIIQNPEEVKGPSTSAPAKAIQGFVKSNKIDIKKSIELIFGVKVSAVNVIKVKGKTKRFKGTIGKRSDYKKAIISLPDGQSIDLSAGV